MSLISYSENERKIVEQGIAAIRQVLLGTDEASKARLLLCLDRYLDPYYGHNLSCAQEVFRLLETVVVSPGSVEIIEDALDLLISYASGPFPLIEQQLESLPSAVRQDAEYAVNMYALHRVCRLALDECVRIFDECRKGNEEYTFGEFPRSAIVVYNTRGDENGDGYDNRDTVEGIWRIADGSYGEIGMEIAGMPVRRSPVSGAFYPEGEFYFNFSMKSNELYLCYILGPRYGRGYKYPIKTDENNRETIALADPCVLWAM